MKNEVLHKDIRYLVSFADQMVSDSEKDDQHKIILLNLAESFLKRLILFYQNEKINCFEGYIYQKLGWIKYYQGDYLKSEKQFYYSIVNLKNCRGCVQELLESYWGLINTYKMRNKIKLAKKYFLIYYSILNQHDSLVIEEDIDQMLKSLNFSVEDLLKK